MMSEVYRYQRFSGLFHGLQVTVDDESFSIDLAFDDSETAIRFRELMNEVIDALEAREGNGVE